MPCQIKQNNSLLKTKNMSVSANYHNSDINKICCKCPKKKTPDWLSFEIEGHLNLLAIALCLEDKDLIFSRFRGLSDCLKLNNLIVNVTELSI